MRRLIALLLCATPALFADGVVARTFWELRAEIPRDALQPLTDPKYGFGLGYLADLGGGPGYIRLRLDGDTFTGVRSNGPVEGLGAGAQVVFEFGEVLGLHTYVAAGPCFEHWSVAHNNAPVPEGAPAESPAWTSNKLALRGDLGLRISRGVQASVGVLTGPMGNGRSATSLFLAVDLKM